MCDPGGLRCEQRRSGLGVGVVEAVRRALAAGDGHRGPAGPAQGGREKRRVAGRAARGGREVDGPVVRFTWYAAPARWLPGRVQPIVIAPLPVSVAVGEVGADRLVATAWAVLE